MLSARAEVHRICFIPEAGGLQCGIVPSQWRQNFQEQNETPEPFRTFLKIGFNQGLIKASLESQSVWSQMEALRQMVAHRAGKDEPDRHPQERNEDRRMPQNGGVYCQ